MKDLATVKNILHQKNVPNRKFFEANSSFNQTSYNSDNLTAVQMLTITEEDVGQRIDNFLLKICKGVPKSHVYQIIRSGQVRVNKGRIDQLYRLQINDVIRIPPMRMAEVKPNNAPRAEFAALYEDAHILVINKPSGVAVHGGSGVSYGVIEQLRAARPDAKFLELVHKV